LGHCRFGNIVRSLFACAFFLNAGRLWRDEADLVHLSLLPSFSEVWQNLPHDSCPILMHLAVRAWSAAASTLLIIEQTHPFASLSQSK
jgi:hypothetical protein